MNEPGVWDIFTGTLVFYWENFRHFVVSSIGYSLLLCLLLFLFLGTAIFSGDLRMIAGTGTFYFAVFLTNLLWLFFALYVTIQAGELYTGQEPSIPELLGSTFQQFLVFVGLSIAAWVLISIGLMLCILPGYVLAIYFTMLAPLVGIAQSGWGSLMECFEVLKDRWFKTFAVLVLMGILFMAVVWLPTLLIGAIFNLKMGAAIFAVTVLVLLGFLFAAYMPAALAYIYQEYSMADGGGPGPRFGGAGDRSSAGGSSGSGWGILPTRRS